MRSLAVSLAVLAGLACAAQAPAAPAIGSKLAPFTLEDQNGAAVDLAAVQGKKAVLLIFVSTECPVSNAYNERMAALGREYGARGVAVFGVNANREESVADVAAHAKAHGFPFPILKDEGNKRADELGAQVTPEAYVYDAGWTLRYHGRIDDDRSGREIGSQDLRNALDAVLAGRNVPVAETKAFGCTIKRVGQ